MGFKITIDLLDDLKKSLIKSTAMLEDLHNGKKLKSSDVTKTLDKNKELIELVELNFNTNYDK